MKDLLEKIGILELLRESGDLPDSQFDNLRNKLIIRFIEKVDEENGNTK